jgi:hypothetical protein
MTKEARAIVRRTILATVAIALWLGAVALSWAPIGRAPGILDLLARAIASAPAILLAVFALRRERSVRTIALALLSLLPGALPWVDRGPRVVLGGLTFLGWGAVIVIGRRAAGSGSSDARGAGRGTRG